jgi:hypothetical protein
MNGADITESLKHFLYIGPGAHPPLNASNILNIKFNLPVFSDETTSGAQINLQLIHKFGPPG